MIEDATGTAPYRRIAAEIRHRIEAGDLRPGDRVPSTRALVQEFGIAMATATKVLAALQQDGLVHPVPGVGTVVGPRPRLVPPGTPRQASRRRPATGRGGDDTGEAVPLSGERVVRTAIAIADEDGLGALSMRRVATELGVSTMALYRYVDSKEALVLQMVDLAVGDFPFPATPPADWRDGIERAARLQWAAYRRHLWLPGAVTLGRPQMLRNLLPHTDAVLQALSGFGLDAATSMYAAVTVFGYVRGVALNLEAEAQAEQDTGLTADEWAASQADALAELIDSEDLPGFRALALPNGFDFDFDLDQLFEFGLQLVLDGLAVKLR
ncbi:MAG TPA: TetR/AcrR family transcriptional regulator C-terminal domain-containing protein [Kribbella sp.]|nr:TetR/AcrR family transcriptional regulator C-terminal domain-containing protein [Kribbella sp.]